jgi:hypothetical protein
MMKRSDINNEDLLLFVLKRGLRNQMLKFAVTLHGKGYLLEVKERHWLLLTRTTKKRAGFYATRFVEALTVTDAAEKALSILEKQVSTLAEKDNNSNLFIENVEEDDESFDLYGEGSGFSWYIDD